MGTVRVFRGSTAVYRVCMETMSSREIMLSFRGSEFMVLGWAWKRIL